MHPHALLANIGNAIDPNLFHMDWERTFEVLIVIILLAFIVERALAIIFESRVFIERIERPGLKESMALALSIAVCWYWSFDAVSMIILMPTTTVPGYWITGAVVAGGSKAAIKLFHDVMNVKSTAYDQRYALQATDGEEKAGEAAAKSLETKSEAQLQSLLKVADRAVTKAKRAAEASGSKAVTAAAERAESARNVVAAQAGILYGNAT